MKTKITSICFAIMFLMTALNANAKTFYVLSGESFQLKPDVGTLLQYKWLEGGIDIPGTQIGTDGTLTKTFDLGTSTAAETKTISLGVLDAVGGCLSTLINHTIVVLPKLTLSVVPLVSNFCQDLTTISTEITASLTQTITDLPTGVSLTAAYKWYKDGQLITGETSEKITVTDIGVYKAERVYDLPTSGLLQSAGAKLADALIGSATIQKSQTTAPTTPDIILQ
jgi:hypothetical protein